MTENEDQLSEGAAPTGEVPAKAVTPQAAEVIPPAGAQDVRSLAAIDLLMEVAPDILADLESKCTWIDPGPDEVVLDRDDESTDVYFVVKGQLKVMIFQGVDDENVSLAELKAGDTFGELSAIDAKKRSARVTSINHVTLARVTRKDFRMLILKCPEIGLVLLKRFAGFIRSLNARITALSTLSPQQRVYFELARMSEPNPSGDGTWIILNLPGHSEIASWAGASREDVAMGIGHLAREGVVERKHKTLIIHDLGRLRMLASQ